MVRIYQNERRGEGASNLRGKYFPKGKPATRLQPVLPGLNPEKTESPLTFVCLRELAG